MPFSVAKDLPDGRDASRTTCKRPRARYLGNHSIKGISRDLSVSRPTIQQILRSDAPALSYECEMRPR